MISQQDVQLLSSARSKQRYSDLSEEERRACRHIHTSLSALGEIVAEECTPTGNVSLKLTSGFHPHSGIRGYIPKDLWFAVFPTENRDRLAANPQLFLIVSERGLEYGFGASVHPSDFSNADAKNAVRAAAPKVFEKLPLPHSAEADSLALQINQSRGWHFRKKHRLPRHMTVENIDLHSWLTWLHSAEGKSSAGGVICRIVDGDAIDQIDLERELREAARLFCPLLLRDWGGEANDLSTLLRETKPFSEDTDPAHSTTGSFDELLRTFLDEYSRARHGAFNLSESLRSAMTSLKTRLLAFPAVSKRPLIDIKISVGQGGWTKTPWIALLNTSVTTTTQQGIYIVFLISEDLSGVTLTLNQGMTELVKTRGQRGAVDEMLRVAAEARVRIPELIKAGFQLDNAISLRSETTAARNYEVGTIAHLDLKPDDLPSDKELEARLEALLAAYDKIVGDAASEADKELGEEVALKDGGKAASSDFPAPPAYGIGDAQEELFLSRERIELLLATWRRKSNLILQGAPGVGKSYVAQRLAYALIGARDPSRVETVQFHQSYSYEDFVQGYRPDGSGGFKLQDGVFHRFRRAALENRGKPHVFVIDEINRGNLSKILGELMLLIESDKRNRDWGTQLAYAKPGEPKFFVPPNLFILGLMNTADRSLSMVDYALRRRFAFATLEPEFKAETFRATLIKRGVPEIVAAAIIRGMSDLNAAIAEDRANLGPGFRIGHSFFVPPADFVHEDGWYQAIIETEIVPLLEEYWFDDPTKADHWRERLLAPLS